MIGWLQGRTVHRFQRGNRNLAVVACAGVGYEVQLAKKDWASFRPDQELELWVHQVVSADALQLYGFPSIAERDLFRELISVNGVGPQAGLALLDTCGMDELAAAVIHSDIKTLCRAPGVGKKTAERLALELRSRLVDSVENHEESLAEVNGAQRELVSTLETLGYEPGEIRSAMERIHHAGHPTEADDEDTWLRACIKLMTESGR